MIIPSPEREVIAWKFSVSDKCQPIRTNLPNAEGVDVRYAVTCFTTARLFIYVQMTRTLWLSHA